MFKFLSLIVAILAVAGGLLVGALNAEAVKLDLLWATLTWPLGLILVMALAIGFLLGMAATWLMQVLPTRMALRRERLAAGARKPDPATNAIADD